MLQRTPFAVLRWLSQVLPPLRVLELCDAPAVGNRGKLPTTKVAPKHAAAAPTEEETKLEAVAEVTCVCLLAAAVVAPQVVVALGVQQP